MEKRLIKHPWFISNSITLIFLIIIALLWIHVNDRYKPSNNQVATKADLDKKVHDFLKKFPEQYKKNEIRIIPTGIFIQSFEFVKSNTVRVSGFIWQKIRKEDLKAGILPGIIFPEANDAIKIKQDYSHDYGSYLLYGWHFQGVTLLQNFNYSSFPFDIQSIWIRLWSKDFKEHIILVPDLESYLSTKPGKVFGLEQDIVKQGFDIVETYFDMPKMRYDTSFGDPLNHMEKDSLELYFNIIVKRHLVNSFLIHLLPIVVIWCILFAISMIISNQEQFERRAGISTTQLFTALGGIIFSVILMNNNLRRNYFDQPILFMEYFYLITYVIILLISYDVYMMTTGCPGKSHTLLRKTLFWPLILGMVILITLCKFFIFPTDIAHWHLG